MIDDTGVLTRYAYQSIADGRKLEMWGGPAYAFYELVIGEKPSLVACFFSSKIGRRKTGELW